VKLRPAAISTISNCGLGTNFEEPPVSTEMPESVSSAAAQQSVTPAILLVMTLVTGIVDAVSYLAVGHVFTANMTGNVVLRGFAVAGVSGLSATRS
jgi:hypothetical protein